MAGTGNPITGSWILDLWRQEQPTRRKCFISYCHRDQSEAKSFLDSFGSVFIAKDVGISDADDFINSTDTDYVIGEIRRRYLQDSTVTILLIGRCTHSRRYVDWELKTTLRRGDSTPNGLLGIMLPSCRSVQPPSFGMLQAGLILGLGLGLDGVSLPERFAANWTLGEATCYAMRRSYPTSTNQLREWIEEAHQRRTTRAESIVNIQMIWKNNRCCKVHGVTH
jgi:hypothetical protein